MFKRYHFILLFLLYFHFTLNLEVNDIEESISCFYAVIGLTGCGKSEFLNAITGKKSFKTSCDRNSITQEFKVAISNYDNKILLGIDTPWLSDSKNNDEKIKKLKEILTVYPRIQKIIIVKKYNDVRIDEALQKAIMVFMESFPITNFWEYVIVVNSWADSRSEIFKDFMENDFQSFRNKINNCENLKNIWKKKK